MRENPYPGINAHLNSLLQTPSTLEQPTIWPAFHGLHIANLVEGLNGLLPDHYIARGEPSIQMRSSDEESLLTHYNEKQDRLRFHRGGRKIIGVLPGEPRQTSVEEDTSIFFATVIREQQPAEVWGKIIARIELLSPSNKPGGSHYDTYTVKRREAIETGIPLIEIDYLHESPSIIRQLPVYPDNADAVPYAILVSDPRPTIHEGNTYVYGFGVGDSIPAFPLPLAGDDVLQFDLNAVYQHTFHAGRWNTILNYAAEPVRFEKYRADDQAKIRAVMNRLTE